MQSLGATNIDRAASHRLAVLIPCIVLSPIVRQVVLLSPEAKNPAKDVPRALFASLLGVTLVCAMASVALSGAEAAPDLDADSAFAEAFRSRGLTVAYKVIEQRGRAEHGSELSILVSILGQTSIFQAMGERVAR